MLGKAFGVGASRALEDEEVHGRRFTVFAIRSSDNSSISNEDVLIDTLLKFRTNRMAFNLRNYHRDIEVELERKRLHKENRMYIRIIVIKYKKFFGALW